MSIKSRLSLRPISADDLDFVDSLRASAGWNQTRSDVWRLLDGNPDCCFLALWDARPVGTVTATCYGTELAWIGLVLVHPDYRRRGIGQSLVERCLDALQQRGMRCVKLDATPLGKSVYERLGFVPQWSLARWQRTRHTDTLEHHGRPVRRLKAMDWDRLAELDRRAFGADRRELLARLAEDSLAARVSLSAEGDVTGFGLLRHGSQADYLGPVVALTTDPGRALVADLLTHARQNGVFWDIPDGNAEAVATAAGAGFSRQRPLVRMSRGELPTEDGLRLPFAIADPATG